MNVCHFRLCFIYEAILKDYTGIVLKIRFNIICQTRLSDGAEWLPSFCLYLFCPCARPVSS